MKMLQNRFYKSFGRIFAGKNSVYVRRIISYIKPYRRRFIQSAVAMSFSGALTTSLMYLIKPIMDRVFKENRSELILPLTGAVIGLALLKGIIQYLHNYLISYVSQNVVKDLRENLFFHLLKLSVDFYEKNTTGKIMSKMTNDIQTVQAFVTHVPADFFKNVFTILGLTGLVFWLNPVLAAVTIFVFPLAFFPIKILGRKMRHVTHSMQRTMADIYTDLHQAIAGQKVIKSYGLEERKGFSFSEKNKTYYGSVMRSVRITAMSGPIMEFIGSLGIAVIIALGGFFVVKGSYTQGDFFAFIGAVVSMYMPLKGLAGINNYLQQVIVSAERIFSILDQEPKIFDSPGSVEISGIKKGIKFDNVSFSIEGKNILQDINLEIPAGGFVALVGKSGAGKTTLINLLMRFYDVTSGSITIDGRNLKDIRISSLRQLISLVPQETVIFSGTVRENLTDGFFIPGEKEIKKALELSHSAEFIARLDGGADSEISEGGMNFSGGERQRLCLARALIREPEILILDEATSALDSVSEEYIRDAIEKMAGEMTIITIAHRMSTIMKADKVFVIEKGAIAGAGTHAELLSGNSSYQALYKAQFKG